DTLVDRRARPAVRAAPDAPARAAVGRRRPGRSQVEVRPEVGRPRPSRPPGRPVLPLVHAQLGGVPAQAVRGGRPGPGRGMSAAALFVAGVAAYIPPVLGAAEAVACGWYDAESYQHDGWTGAAVAGDMSPAEMALRASRVALDRSGCDPAELDILLYASSFPQGPHAWFPQYYVERHAVGGDIPAVELRQGCSGILV